ncbi:hypothetical protein [Aquimarina agarivorans]|uniref:hypothetical protein n=1 Tax=Aquimarina agarivorans TaxID=980584 RepID=UPI000248E830|nr:hypothetical protein [Aquimarina agarivorans]
MKYLRSIFVLFYCLVTSCVTEEDAFDKDISNPEKTSFVLSVFDYYQVNDNNPSKCFEFIYPFSVASNKNNRINFSAKQGMNDFFNLQNSKFFANSVVFPFNVVLLDGTLLTVENRKDFEELLSTCEIPSFTTRTFTETDCVQFEYPVEVISETNSDQKVTITDSETLASFASNPTLEFPVISYPVNTNFGTTINSEFEHLTLLNDCQTAIENSVCPEFEIEVVDFGDAFEILNFLIETENDKIPTETIWTVNGEVIDGESRPFLQFDFTDLNNRSRFGELRYDVCAKAFFEDCLIEREVCVVANFESEVNENCLKDIDFLITTTDVPGLLNFEALFEPEDEDNTSYVWTVGGEPIGEIFKKVSFQFDNPGIYFLCLSAREIGLDCNSNQGNNFPTKCIRIGIDENLAPITCQTLVFILPTISNSEEGRYNYEADYSALDQSEIVYTWSLDNRIVPDVTTNKVSFNFNNPQTYEICVAVSNPNCPEDTEIRRCVTTVVRPEDIAP